MVGELAPSALEQRETNRRGLFEEYSGHGSDALLNYSENLEDGMYVADIGGPALLYASYSSRQSQDQLVAGVDGFDAAVGGPAREVDRNAGGYAHTSQEYAGGSLLPASWDSQAQPQDLRPVASSISSSSSNSSSTQQPQLRWAYSADIFQAQMRQYQQSAIANHRFQGQSQSQSQQSAVPRVQAMHQMADPAGRTVSDKRKYASQGCNSAAAGSSTAQQPFDAPQPAYIVQQQPMRLVGNGGGGDRRGDQDRSSAADGQAGMFSEAQGHDAGTSLAGQAGFPGMHGVLEGHTGYSNLWTNGSATPSPGITMFGDLQGQSPAGQYNPIDGQSPSFDIDKAGQMYGQWQPQEDRDMTYSLYMAACKGQADQSQTNQADGLMQTYQPAQAQSLPSPSTQSHHNLLQNGFTDQLQPYQPASCHAASFQAHSYPGASTDYLDIGHFQLPDRYYPTLHYDYTKPKEDGFLQAAANSPVDGDAEGSGSAYSAGSASDHSASRGQKRDRTARGVSHVNPSGTRPRRGSVPILSSGTDDAWIPASKHGGPDKAELDHSETLAGNIEPPLAGAAPRRIAGRPARHDRVPSLSRLHLDQAGPTSTKEIDSAASEQPSVLKGPPFYTATVFPPVDQQSDDIAVAQPHATRSSRQSACNAKGNDDTGHSASSASDKSANAGSTRRMYECKICGRSEFCPKPFRGAHIDLEL